MRHVMCMPFKVSQGIYRCHDSHGQVVTEWVDRLPEHSEGAIVLLQKEGR